MQINLVPLLVFLATTVVSVAVTFYLKDYLQKRAEYSKLRRKLDKIAGKHAPILYGGQLFKIAEIDEDGITVNNELQTVFIPSNKLLSSEMILPCDNYDVARLAKMKKDMNETMDVLMPAMLERMFPEMLKAIQEQLLSDMIEETGEVSAVIGIKIQKVLSEEGFEIKKRLPPSGSQIP